MDEWVKTLRMKKTIDLVDLKELQKKNKKRERLKNDEKDSEDEEHEGMDETAIAAHEEATKVKTVLEIGKYYFKKKFIYRELFIFFNKKFDLSKNDYYIYI